MAYGQKANVGLIFQNSYGYHVDSSRVGNVNSIHFIPFLSESLNLKKPPLYSQNIRGVFDEGDTYEGANMVEGSIEAEAQPIAVGAMLKSIFNLESSTLVDSVYQHLFRPRTADFDENCANNPVTGYVYLDTGSAMLYPDITGAVLEIGIANGEFLNMKVDYVGGNFIQNAAVAASLPTGKRWTWDVASVSFGGTGVDEIVNLTITIDDGSLEASHTVNNSLYPSRIKRTDWRTIAIDGTLKFDNQDEYQEFIGQTERELLLNFKGKTTIASGYTEDVLIQLPLMRYEASEPEAGGPGEIEMSITARGKYSVTSATGIQITLTNTQAAY